MVLIIRRSVLDETKEIRRLTKKGLGFKGDYYFVRWVIRLTIVTFSAKVRYKRIDTWYRKNVISLHHEKQTLNEGNTLASSNADQSTNETLLAHIQAHHDQVTRGFHG